MIVSRKMAEEAWALLMPYSFHPATTVDRPPAFDALTDKLVDRSYKVGAMVKHPDKGGSPEEFVALDRAKHMLLAYLAKQGQSEGAKPHGGVTPCQKCNGTGRIALQRGFKQMQVQCPGCKGNGELYDEREGEVNRNG